MSEIFQGKKKVDFDTQESLEPLKTFSIDSSFSDWEFSIWTQSISPKSSTGALVLSLFLSNTYF